jgi:starch phosphorylase
VLTIGFARRFAEYKRATMLFQFPERLKAMLLNPQMPVQIVMAGKSHPRDETGKAMIRQIVQFSQDPEVRHRVVFLPDYSMSTARLLIQGSDVWLNNPRRPLEASGTSGEKAALNGVLNISIRDGWWDEMFNGENGWAIASAENYADLGKRDAVEAASLFDILERLVIPRFYEPREASVPTEWVKMIKSSLKSLAPRVSASRMLRDYLLEMYEPLATSTDTLHSDDFKLAKDLAHWKARVSRSWDQVAIVSVENGDATFASRGDVREVNAVVELGELTPEDVSVQLVHGRVGSGDELHDSDIVPMELVGPEPGTNGRYGFRGSFVCEVAGRYGFSLRVVPSHPNLASFAELGKITWAS